MGTLISIIGFLFANVRQSIYSNSNDEITIQMTRWNDNTKTQGDKKIKMTQELKWRDRNTNDTKKKYKWQDRNTYDTR